MKPFYLLPLLAGCCSLPAFSGAAEAPAAGRYVPDLTFPAQPMPPALSPEDELKTFLLPRGYHLELVLSDPLIQEPVLCTFDGNGRMYVAEMRTYMQNADAKNELAPASRVSRHASSRGDGTFDQHSVFLDQVLLPRMVLPLDRGQVLIGLSNTYDLDLYTDPHDTGTADGKRSFYVGGSNGGNIEHQPSGLLWSMDNWIYTTYNNFRLRWTPGGTARKEPTAVNGGQWGLAQDDHGKLWWSNAGAEKGLFHFQTHVLYGAMDIDGQFDPGFMEVWPAAGMADFQGGPPRSRPDKTLNHFTGCGGQEVFRGDRLPADLRGDVLLPEPVGRLIRRARVVDKDGMTYVSNPYQAEHAEFIRSTDPYFRPSTRPRVPTAASTSWTCTGASSRKATGRSRGPTCGTWWTSTVWPRTSIMAASGASCTTTSGRVRSHGCSTKTPRSWWPTSSIPTVGGATRRRSSSCCARIHRSCRPCSP